MNFETALSNMGNPKTTQDIVQAHPVLVVFIGTTMGEVGLILKNQIEGSKQIVPWRCLCIDSMRYEQVTERFEKEGWTTEQISSTLPKSHFFELPNPFSADFNFEHPLNRSWKKVLFDPALQRIAQKTESPGCNGPPALGRARVEGSFVELSGFFEKHLSQLTLLREDTLALQRGVIAFVVTTYRGGTGTGASLLVAAALKEHLHDSQIHLHAVMPDAYQADSRAKANAFACVLETQGYHKYGHCVPTKDDRAFPLLPPFDSVNYVFGTNGTVTLGHKDILMQEAALISSYLKAATQSAILGRHVDLTDVNPFDHQDRPLHVRTETALSINVVPPGILDYLASRWVDGELRARNARFEQYAAQGDLLADEENSLVHFIDQVRSDPGLSFALEKLLLRLDPTPNPANALRAFFERIANTIGSMEAATIKEQIKTIIPKVKDDFVRYEAAWKANAVNLAKQLPKEIETGVRSRFAGEDHLAVAAIRRLRQFISANCTQLETDIKALLKLRDESSRRLSQALQEVQEAGGALSFVIGSTKVVRHAALRVCENALQAALTRLDQHKKEYLLQAIQSAFDLKDNQGQVHSIPGVVKALENLEAQYLTVCRKKQAERLETLEKRIKGFSQAIKKRSATFQRSLLYDGVSQQTLDQMVEKLRTQFPEPLPLAEYLRDEKNLETTVAELKPLLPAYADTRNNLSDILAADPKKRELLCHLLACATPFTPIDEEIEAQQGFRNRRDNLTILEIPGGRTAPLARVILDKDIIADPNQIIDSGDDEIRMYYLRDGLSYGIVRPFRNSYAQAYREHMGRASSIPPHTFEGYHNLPEIEPPRLNISVYIRQLLAWTKAILPSRFVAKPSGGYRLFYEEENDQGFKRQKQEDFKDIEAAISWLARRPRVYKALESEIKSDLDTSPEVHRLALVAAWQNAQSSEKDCLEEVLCDLQIDPVTYQAPVRRNKALKKTAVDRINSGVIHRNTSQARSPRKTQRA